MFTLKLHPHVSKTLAVQKAVINRLNEGHFWSKISSSFSVLSSSEYSNLSNERKTDGASSRFSNVNCTCFLSNVIARGIRSDLKYTDSVCKGQIQQQACKQEMVDRSMPEGILATRNVSCSQVVTKNNFPALQTIRNFSTGMRQNEAKGPSLLTRMLWKVGIGKLRYNKSRMRLAACKLYLCCDELVDHFEMTQVLGLPDTFYSWYLSMELHVWLMMVRLHQEGEEGKYVKHMLVKALWDDVENRSKKLGHAALTSARRVGIKEIGNHFQAALFAYDEGALGDDRVLGAAIWRIVFEMQDVDPVLIELIVAYVRKQLKHLDGQLSENLLLKGQTTFLPIYGDEELVDNREKLEEILARSIQ
ncbi:ubiquinol-cytochrome c reductase complex assembly factor 1-like [Lineus longissimus]|uniref:ubiquinol-cytochrome c reductase complex assembly factor 1-like n=1 Tax=Lineus longissimus TaxID=88925 RepID=UPI002B4D1A04